MDWTVNSHHNPASQRDSLLHRHEVKSPLDVEGVRAVKPVPCKTDEAFHQRWVVIHT